MNILVFCAVFFVGVHTCAAQTMTVDADRFEMVKDQQRADFFGHVVVHRDDVVIKADKMKVWYKEVGGRNELKTVRADGNVHITTETKMGEADYASFEAGSQMLILTGNAKVIDGDSAIEGEVIEYNMKTEHIQVRKGKSGKQVHFTFDEAQ